MNIFIFTGNLTKDCRTAVTPNGKSVCNFTVANTTGKGTDYEHTEFIDCAIFGKRAEGKMPQYLVKGQKVTISGEARVNQREYEGNHYANISVMVEKLDFGGRSGATNTVLADGGQPSPQAAADLSNDIPF